MCADLKLLRSVTNCPHRGPESQLSSRSCRPARTTPPTAATQPRHKSGFRLPRRGDVSVTRGWHRQYPSRFAIGGPRVCSRCMARSLLPASVTTSTQDMGHDSIACVSPALPGHKGPAGFNRPATPGGGEAGPARVLRAGSPADGITRCARTSRWQYHRAEHVVEPPRSV